MRAYKLETKVDDRGQLRLSKLPFHPGDDVEVIVIQRYPARNIENPYPLRGLPYRYDQPTAPVADDDWEALK